MADLPLTKLQVELPNHGGVGGESMWARELGANRFRLENVPFYAYDLNFHDVVEAHPLGADQQPTVQRVIERSGHTTLRVRFEDDVSEERRLELLHSLQPLSVSYERYGPPYFALDLEPGADVDAVRDRLDAWYAEGLLDYETCEARVEGSFDAAPDDRTDD